MIHIVCFHLAATVSVAMAGPLSVVKTTTPSAESGTARNAATSKAGPATTQSEARPTTLRRATTTTTPLPSTVAFLDHRTAAFEETLAIIKANYSTLSGKMRSQTTNVVAKKSANDSQAQLGKDFEEEFFSGEPKLDKGMENGGYEISNDDDEVFQVTEVEVIILESGEMEDQLRDVQKRLLVTSQSAESEHVLQYFKYVTEENSEEDDLLSQGFKTLHQPEPSDAESEGSILILLGLGSQSNDVQSEKEFDLDRLSSIEGDVEVWPLMAGVALVTACILFSCLALMCLWRWMKVLIKREEKGGSIGKKAVLTWTTSNHYSFPQDETYYPPSSTILSRKLSGYKGVPVVGLISPAPKRPSRIRRSSSTSPVSSKKLLRPSDNVVLKE